MQERERRVIACALWRVAGMQPGWGAPTPRFEELKLRSIGAVACSGQDVRMSAQQVHRLPRMVRPLVRATAGTRTEPPACDSLAVCKEGPQPTAVAPHPSMLACMHANAARPTAAAPPPSCPHMTATQLPPLDGHGGMHALIPTPGPPDARFVVRTCTHVWVTPGCTCTHARPCLSQMYRRLRSPGGVFVHCCKLLAGIYIQPLQPLAAAARAGRPRRP